MEKRITCPKCEALVRETANFCPQCGKQLKANPEIVDYNHSDLVQMQYALNDGSSPVLTVAEIVHKKFDSMIIQISKVVHYYIDQVPQFRYVYEEIDHNDFVQYARYMGIENIRRNYEWAGM